MCTALLVLLPQKLERGSLGQKGKSRPEPERPQDVIREFVCRGSVSIRSGGGPRPRHRSRLVLVTELEVGVESKEIKFMSRDQTGLRH